MDSVLSGVLRSADARVQLEALGIDAHLFMEGFYPIWTFQIYQSSKGGMHMRKILSAIMLLVLIATAGSMVLASEAPERGIVKITAESEGRRKAGSGFVLKIDINGAYIVTASHVVLGDKFPKVQFSSQQTVEATVRTIEGGDPSGLALLFVRRNRVPPKVNALRLATAHPGSHEELTVMGFPRAVDFLSVVTDTITLKGRSLVFMRPLTEGFSGSPMLKGVEVAGIVVESTGDYAYGLPVGDIRQFMIGSGIPPAPELRERFVGKWGREGTGNGRFQRAWGIAVNLGGTDVFVLDHGGSNLQVFSPMGNFKNRLEQKIMGPFVDVAGFIIYVLNYDPGTGRNSRVERYVFNKFERRFLLQGNSPRGIATNNTGKYVYVTDISTNKVYRYDDFGNKLGEWGGLGPGNSQFRNPWGLTVDTHQKKRVYVADTGNNRIQAFSFDGRFLLKWGSKGSGDGQFESPIDVAVDVSHGYVYVLDRRNARVQVFDPEGQFLGKWGRPGRGDGEFMDPYGIAIDGNDNVYVMDSGNCRVQAFRVQWE